MNNIKIFSNSKFESINNIKNLISQYKTYYSLNDIFNELSLNKNLSIDIINDLGPENFNWKNISTNCKEDKLLITFKEYLNLEELFLRDDIDIPSEIIEYFFCNFKNLKGDPILGFLLSNQVLSEELLNKYWDVITDNTFLTHIGYTQKIPINKINSKNWKTFSCICSPHIICNSKNYLINNNLPIDLLKNNKLYNIYLETKNKGWFWGYIRNNNGVYHTKYYFYTLSELIDISNMGDESSLGVYHKAKIFWEDVIAEWVCRKYFKIYSINIENENLFKRIPKPFISL